MQKETGPPVRPAFLQFSCQQQQMVVMHPDVVFFPRVLHNRQSELVVHGFIGSPVAGLKVTARRQVVEQRPQDFIRESEVILVDFFPHKTHRLERVTALPCPLLQKILEARFLMRRFSGHSQPPDPHSSTIPQYRGQCRHQAARSGLDGGSAVPILFDDHGQTIRDDG